MELKSGDYPWCIAELKVNTVIFKCERCKEIHTFDNAGMPIDEFCKKSEAFCELHRNCKEK